MSLLKVTQLTHSFRSTGVPGVKPWAGRGLQPLNSHPHSFQKIPGSVDSCGRRRSQVGAQIAHSKKDSIASLRLCCFSFFPRKIPGCFSVTGMPYHLPVKWPQTELRVPLPKAIWLAVSSHYASHSTLPAYPVRPPLRPHFL